jgi:lysosomal Pro-X carboxypeptidase
MLAAYIRIKYPNLIAGSIAGSAPVKFFPGQFDCRGFYRVTTRTFENTPAGKVCADNIRDSWAVINQIGSHMVGKKLLSDTFNTCKVITDTAQLTGFLENVWGSLAMMDYPYPTNFMGNVPGWPVSVACESLNKTYGQLELLDAIHNAAQVYYNSTGTMKCLDLGDGGDSPDLGYDGWYYQTCTEFVMPFCADGKEDMFMVHTFDLDKYEANCLKQFGTHPRPNWPEIYFNVDTMKQIGNIIFSNGHLDPWSSGGVLDPLEAGHKNFIFIIDQGAHHLDLRATNPLDPPQVTEFRDQYVQIMQGWINAELENAGADADMPNQL